MATHSVTPATIRPGYARCPQCGGEIINAITAKGQAIALDTRPEAATYVIVGWDKDGTAKVVGSGGYVVHAVTCAQRGAKGE